MQHLNYCRQMVKQLTPFLGIPNFPAELKRMGSHALDLAGASTKFMLPETGRLYDDPDYRALDETEELNLPFDFVALEYSRRTVSQMNGPVLSTKAIVFARQRADEIFISPVCWIDSQGMWIPMREISIPRTGYLDRTQPKGGYKGNHVAIVVRADSTIDPRDYTDEVGTLLCFLNVLNCKNVQIERSELGNVRKAMSGKKGALPFDTYHVLTIDPIGKASGTGAAIGGHRSPREHLRRGHIRRLTDDRRVWVNATVVAAGRGAGVVTKDYALRAAA